MQEQGSQKVDPNGIFCHGSWVDLRLEELAVGVWTLEKRKRPFSSDKRKADQQSGVLCHGSWVDLRLEELAVGVWTLEKRRHPLSSERHKTE
ncbi:hypothetical protein D9754_12765 [Planomicrobium sp. Y74]|nr:hypothetical protein D9754_12765 [Planomicrobium sp. Y74]